MLGRVCEDACASVVGLKTQECGLAAVARYIPIHMQGTGVCIAGACPAQV